jgi:hypothetical protein
MKKRTKVTKTPQHAWTVVLTEQELTSVVGGIIDQEKPQRDTK